MSGIFDNFNASQANNGQAQPNPQVASGAPGFQFGSWGNQPPNMAGGLQQFLASRGMARPQPGGMAGGVMQGGAVTQPQQPGMPMNASQGPSSAAVMPQQSPMLGASQPGIGASSPSGGASYAGGMQQFLGARPT